MEAVVLQRVADGVLEVVDRHKVREEGKDVLDLDQVVAFLAPGRRKRNKTKIIWDATPASLVPPTKKNLTKSLYA